MGARLATPCASAAPVVPTHFATRIARTGMDFPVVALAP